MLTCFFANYGASPAGSISLYPIIFHYIPLYSIIFHYIPLYSIIFHYIPLYPIISPWHIPMTYPHVWLYNIYTYHTPCVQLYYCLLLYIYNNIIYIVDIQYSVYIQYITYTVSLYRWFPLDVRTRWSPVIRCCSPRRSRSLWRTSPSTRRIGLVGGTFNTQ